MQDVASEFGTAIASCLIWWPISFVAVKGSLHLTYRWRPFLSGFAWSIVALTIARLVLHAVVPANVPAGQELDTLNGTVEFAGLFILPTATCAAVAFLLRDRFSPKVVPPTKVVQNESSRQSPMGVLRTASMKFRLSPEALIGCLALIALLAIALFPPWLVFYPRGFEFTLGHEFIFSDPSYDGLAARIDVPLLATQCLVVGALTGISLILLYAYRSNRRNQSGKSEPLLNQVMGAATDAIVTGYRKIAAANGCAPTQKTTDREIVELYYKVASEFKDAAKSRGEYLRAGVINRIVLKFLQLKESMGEPFLDDHLSYEVEKYRSEGLRSDYQHELSLF